MSAITPDDADAFGELARRLHDDADDAVLAEYRNCFDHARAAARQRLHEPLVREDYEMNDALAQSTELSLEVLAAVHATLRTGIE